MQRRPSSPLRDSRTMSFSSLREPLLVRSASRQSLPSNGIQAFDHPPSLTVGQFSTPALSQQPSQSLHDDDDIEEAPSDTNHGHRNQEEINGAWSLCESRFRIPAFARPFLFSVILGLAVGAGGMLAVHWVQKAQDHWYRILQVVQDSTTDENSITEYEHLKEGDSKWIIWTGLGGTLAGIVLLQRASQPSHDFSMKQFDIMDTRDAIIVLIASTISIIAAAPVGPELMLYALASLMAVSLKRLMGVSVFNANKSMALSTLLPVPLAGAILQLESSTENLASYYESVWLVLLSSLSAYFGAAYIRLALGYDQGLLLNPEVFRNEYYLFSTLLGFVGALGGILVLVVSSLTRRIASGFTYRLHQNNSSKWFPPLFCCSFAGVLHGTLSVFFPLSGGTGMSYLNFLFATDTMETRTPYFYLMNAVVKALIVGSSLSFGLLGSSIWPLAYIGILLGIAMTKAFPVIPLVLSVSCCITSCLVSTTALPLTVGGTVVMLFALGAEYSTCLLLASALSYFLSHTCGISTYLNRDIKESGEVSEEEDDEDDIPIPVTPSDHEILQDVRLRIFGAQNTV